MAAANIFPSASPRSPTTNSRSSRSPRARSCRACKCSMRSRTARWRWAIPLYYYWGKNPAFTFGTSLPFGLNTRTHRLAEFRRRHRAAQRPIDAAEWVGPYDDEKVGFVKVAKYYYYPGWREGTGQGHNVINLDKWNQLPKHYQAAI